VGLHERHVSTAWAISVVVGGNRRPTTGAGRSTMREAQGETNLPAKGADLYRIEAELKLLVLRLFVSLIYRPITNPANIRSGIKDPKSGAVEIVVVVIKCAINNAPCTSRLEEVTLQIWIPGLGTSGYQVQAQIS
jgi:hypothetical protein